LRLKDNERHPLIPTLKGACQLLWHPWSDVGILAFVRVFGRNEVGQAFQPDVRLESLTYILIVPERPKALKDYEKAQAAFAFRAGGGPSNSNKGAVLHFPHPI
jgi:hypothetical protein